MRSRLSAGLTAALLCGLASAVVGYPKPPEPPTPDPRPQSWPHQQPARPCYPRQPVVAPRQWISEPPPPVGWTTEARVLSVYDGDTVVIEIRRELRVRLLDCWAPEIRTRDAREKARGFAARNFVRQLLPDGSPVTLHVPAHGAELAEVWSMGRVLGSLWIPGDDRPLSRRIVEAGHATTTKDGK